MQSVNGAQFITPFSISSNLFAASSAPNSSIVIVLLTSIYVSL